MGLNEVISILSKPTTLLCIAFILGSRGVILQILAERCHRRRPDEELTHTLIVLNNLKLLHVLFFWLVG